MKLGMLPETLKALEGSICKWNNVCMGFGAEKGYTDCPLCTLFYLTSDCYGCPVEADTGVKCCGLTPYHKWDDAWDNEFVPFHQKIPLENLINKKFVAKVAEIAEAELLYLLHLLPEDHPWREMI